MQQRGEEARVLGAPKLLSHPFLKNGALTMITLVSDSVKGATLPSVLFYITAEGFIQFLLILRT